MIVLHNSGDKASRDFVASLGARPGLVVLDWYKGGREEWMARGGNMGVSAFPAIVVEVPAYLTPATESMGKIEAIDGTATQLYDQHPAVMHPARTEMIRKPLNMVEVQGALDKFNVCMSVSRDAGHDVADLTLDDLDNVARHQR